MLKSARRYHFSRGKGLLSASGPQARFILFLMLLLVVGEAPLATAGFVAPNPVA